MIHLKIADYLLMLSHARACLPEEACGLIAGRECRGKDGEILRRVEKVYLLENTDHSPEHFTLSPREQLHALRDMRSLGLSQLGNWHSHPETPARQSEEDKRLAFDHGASYLILSLMQPDRPVLKAFRYDGLTSSKDRLVIEGEAAEANNLSNC